jgi:TRAP-type C4-dicarboxylate transport system permease small subunit
MSLFSAGESGGSFVTPILGIIGLLETAITWVLRLGRMVAWVAIGLMVVVTIVQVFFRYVLNDALPWPDEAARFLMLWMTGLVAPSAYRWGGFVAIEMLKDALGRSMSIVLNLAILAVSLAVLVVALQFGLKHVASGWLFASSSLKLPLSLIGMQSVPIKLAWMYMSLPVGFAIMIAVNIELVLKNVVMLFDKNADYSVAPDQIVISAE